MHPFLPTIPLAGSPNFARLVRMGLHFGPSLFKTFLKLIQILKACKHNNILTCFSYFPETEDIKDEKEEKIIWIKKSDIKLKPGQQKFIQDPLEALRLKKQSL